MLIAFHGADGRSAATYAALVAASALTAADRPGMLLRIVGPRQGPARVASTMPEALRIVEAAASTDPAALRATIDEAASEGRDVFLDLPLSWMGVGGLPIDLTVVAVGPSPLDERLATGTLARTLGGIDTDGSGDDPASRGPRGAPVWLLGCNRSAGGPDAVRFERSMRSLIAGEGSEALAGCRFLPVTLATPSHGEAFAVSAGYPTDAVRRQGMLLVAAISAAAGDPFAATVDLDGLARALGLDGTTVVTADQRRLSQRLRDLADDLDAMDRDGPPADELAEAPLMEDWSFRSGRTRVIAGLSFGHPTIPSGRLALTSDVFATDGRTWARTLSRFVRLGAPAGAVGPSGGLQ